jgi:hypothetical protein
VRASSSPEVIRSRAAVEPQVNRAVPFSEPLPFRPRARHPAQSNALSGVLWLVLAPNSPPNAGSWTVQTPPLSTCPSPDRIRYLPAAGSGQSRYRSPSRRANWPPCGSPAGRHAPCRSDRPGEILHLTLIDHSPDPITGIRLFKLHRAAEAVTRRLSRRIAGADGGRSARHLRRRRTAEGRG